MEGVPPRPRGASSRCRRHGGRRQGQGRACVQEATRREGLSVHRGGGAPPGRPGRQDGGAARGRGRRLLAVADALSVTVLAAIAGAGSFTHIRDTAAGHGQGGPMSWAVAVCT